RVCQKALARDVDDRYQTAAELANDLRTVLEGYRFERAEMVEFVRGLFRSDYAREREEIEACQVSEPPTGGDALELPAPELLGAAPASPREAALPLAAAPLGAVDSRPSHPRSEPRGLWARIKGRFGK